MPAPRSATAHLRAAPAPGRAVLREATPVAPTRPAPTRPAPTRPAPTPAAAALSSPRLALAHSAAAGVISRAGDAPAGDGLPYGVSAQAQRRTVRIQGRGADPWRSAPSTRSRSGSQPLSGLVGSRPDRLAMWATVLGFLLVVVAILSSHF